MNIPFNCNVLKSIAILSIMGIIMIHGNMMDEWLAVIGLVLITLITFSKDE